MEINFYQALGENLLPSVVRLLEKSYEAQKKCVFFSPIEDRVALVDKTLWTFSKISFIPHGDKGLGHCELQPIYFTSSYENPNGAEVAVILDSFDYKSFGCSFNKVLFVFDESNSDQAGCIYSSLKKNGDNVNYWEQSSKGWEKRV